MKKERLSSLLVDAVQPLEKSLMLKIKQQLLISLYISSPFKCRTVKYKQPCHLRYVGMGEPVALAKPVAWEFAKQVEEMGPSVTGKLPIDLRTVVNGGGGQCRQIGYTPRRFSLANKKKLTEYLPISSSRLSEVLVAPGNQS